MGDDVRRDLPAAPELERMLAEIVEMRMGQTSTDEIAYELWEWMNRRGYIELDELCGAQRRVAGLMIRNRLVEVREGRMKQMSLAAQIDRWASLR